VAEEVHDRRGGVLVGDDAGAVTQADARDLSEDGVLDRPALLEGSSPAPRRPPGARQPEDEALTAEGVAPG
jgi:hypothetical protein